jgi:hypothetical protein
MATMAIGLRITSNAFLQQLPKQNKVGLLSLLYRILVRPM